MAQPASWSKTCPPRSQPKCGCHSTRTAKGSAKLMCSSRLVGQGLGTSSGLEVCIGSIHRSTDCTDVFQKPIILRHAMPLKLGHHPGPAACRDARWPMQGYGSADATAWVQAHAILQSYRSLPETHIHTQQEGRTHLWIFACDFAAPGVHESPPGFNGSTVGRAPSSTALLLS